MNAQSNDPLQAYRGIFSAMLTPLTEDERLDAEAAAGLANTLLDEGQRGLYLAGGTGEEFAVDDAMRMELFRVAAQVAHKRGRDEKMLAHVGGVPTRRAVAMACAAAEAGCDAIAAIPPHGGKYSYEELSGYYRTLSEATPLPLIVYHIPEVSGYDFPREKLSRWLEMPKTLGIKFTSYDLFRLERLASLHPEKAIFTGADQVLAQGLASGACGAIGSTYNLLGPLAVSIFEAVRRQDLEAAIPLQARLNHFVEQLGAAGGVRAFKALAAHRLGWTSARSPAPGMTPGLDSLRAMEAALLAASAHAPAAA